MSKIIVVLIIATIFQLGIMGEDEKVSAYMKEKFLDDYFFCRNVHLIHYMVRIFLKK